MSAEHVARALALMDTRVHGLGASTAPMVDVTFPIRADALAWIDALCNACAPLEMPREKMLRMLVQTGIMYWEPEGETVRHENVGDPQEQTLDVPVEGGRA